MSDNSDRHQIELLSSKIDQLASVLDRPAQRFLNVSNAAHYCDLSPESIRRMIAAGKLTPLRPVRGRILLDRKQLDTVVQSSTSTVRKGRGGHKKQ